MARHRSWKLFLTTFIIIFMMGISIQVISQVISSLRATNTSQLVVDNNANGLADGGDIIQYTVQVANCSGSGVGGINYQSDIDPNTSLIPNSLQITTTGTTLCGNNNTTTNPPSDPPAPTAVIPPTIPIVTTTTPANGATEVAINSNITVTFSEAVTVSGNWVQVVCTVSGTFDITSANLTVSGGATTYTLDPDVDLQIGESCTVTVFASGVVDAEAQNPVADYIFNFAVEKPPTVTTTNPANGAVAIDTATDIIITFDEPVNVTAGSFTLECPAPIPYAPGFAVSGSGTAIITINPALNLPAGTICAVNVIAAFVTDLDGNNLDGNGDLTAGDDYPFSFTTDVDAAPFVASIVPADSVVGVASNTTITITFSEPVDLPGAGAFSLECGGAPQGYTVTTPPVFPLDPLVGASVFVITPASNLPDGVPCIMTVFGASVNDVDVNDPPDLMGANFTSTFTTDAPPSVTTTTPANFDTGVSTSANIVVNFDEPVDVTTSSFTIECPAGGTSYTYTIVGNGTNSITLDPNINLVTNETCTVTVVANQVNDSDPVDPPQNMVANVVFSFTTINDAAPTVNQPAIAPASSTTGANSASLDNPVSTTPTITIPFSEAVTVASGGFTLVCNATPVIINVTPALPNTSTSFNISPSVSLTEGANCVLTVNQANVTDADTDDPPNVMANNFTLSFNVDTAPAEIFTETEVGNFFQDVTVAGAVNVDLDSNIQIIFNEAVTVTFPANGLQCPGGNNIPVTVTANSGTTIVLNPDVNLPLNTLCVLAIPAGNISDVDTADAPDIPVAGVNHTFTTVDDDAPTVSTNPANGGANIAVNSNITVTFNEPVTLTGTWFDLNCSISGNRVSTGELTGTGITIIENTPDLVYTIDTLVDFASGDVCTITIDSANVVDNDPIDPPNNLDGDASGDIIDDADNYVAIFSTTDIAPSVTTTTPIDSVTVANNQAVTINFNELVSLSNVPGTGITWVCNATPVAYTVGATANITSITLTPSGALPNGATCTVTVNDLDVSDDDPIDPPSNMTADFVLNFTVDAQPTILSNQVEIGGVLSPASGAVNVDLDTNIVVTFSEAVNADLTSFALDCGGVITFAVLGTGTNTITVDPTPAILPINTPCDFDIIALNVSDVDTADAPDTLPANVNFTFTTVNDNPPSVTSAEVEVGTVFTALPLGALQFADPDTDLRIQFSEAVTVTGNWAELVCTTSGTQDVTGGLVVTDADPIFTFNPTSNLAPGESCTLTIFSLQVVDEDAPIQNMGANAVFTFTVADAPPRVDTATSTPINSAIVPNTQVVTLNFTELVDIQAGAITFVCNATPVAFTPALPQNNVTTITLTPSSALTNGVVCTVTLESTLITDDDIVDGPDELDGSLPNDNNNGDADNFVLNFTVDAPPRVTNNVPANGATNVPVANNIVINFSEAVDIAAGGITLDCGAGAIAFAPALPLLNITLNINPTLDLPGGATCTVTVLASGVTDFDAFDPPNQLDGDNNGVEGDNYTFSFTTQNIAIPDAYTINPHLTHNRLLTTDGVLNNDQPNTVSVTRFGDTAGTVTTVANGTNFITAGGANGRVVMNANGTFSFYPDAGDNDASGTVTFFYEITGGSIAQVTLTYQAGDEFLWFVDSTPPSTVCTGTNVGTQACPATDIPTIQPIDTANDIIMVAEGNYTCNMTMEAGVWLVGDGAAAGSLGGLITPRITVISPFSTLTPYVTFTNNDPVFTSAGDCFTLSTNNRILGVTIGNTTGYAIASTVNIGTFNGNQNSIIGSGGLFSLTGGGTFNASFDTLTSTGHISFVAVLSGMSGTITNTAGSISHNVINSTIVVNGGNPTFTYNGNITKTAGSYVVQIENTTGNTVTFNNTIQQIVAAGSGILINNAAGNVTFNTLNLGDAGTRLNNVAISIINSSGTFNLGTVSVFTNNAQALTATSLSATASGTINSTTGEMNATNARAIQIDGPTGLTTLGMTLTSVSSTNTTNGMLIQDTNGTFTVTGDGGGANNGSGGLIDNIATDAVVLNNTAGLISLNYMIIEDVGNMAGGIDTLTGHNAIDGVTINGGLSLNRTIIRRISDQAIFGGTFGSPDTATVWNGLTITNSLIENTNRYHLAGIGDANNEGMIRILGIRGTVNITNSTLQDGAEMLDFFVTAGTLNLNVTTSAFNRSYKEFTSGTRASVGNHCIDVVVQGASNANVTVGSTTVPANGNDFLNCRIGSIRVVNDAGATGNTDFIVANNDFVVTDHSSGIGGDFDFPQGGVLAWIVPSGGGTMDVVVQNNLFDTVTNASGGVGQLTLAIDNGTMQARVTGNTFDIPGNAPWLVEARGGDGTVQFVNNTVNRGAFPCTIDPACGGGYFGPGLRTLFNAQQGSILNVTMTNNVMAQHDTGFDPGQTVEFRALNTGAAPTMCVALTNNQSPDGYSLEQFAGTFNLDNGANAFTGACSAAQCQGVLNTNGNTGAGGVGTTAPPFVNVLGTVNVTNTPCALPVGPIFP